MEVFFVYGLVIAFFILLAPVIYLFMKDPLPHSAEDQKIADEKANTPPTKKPLSEKIAYGILVALLTSVCVLTVLVQKTKN